MLLIISRLTKPFDYFLDIPPKQFSVYIDLIFASEKLRIVERSKDGRGQQ